MYKLALSSPLLSVNVVEGFTCKQRKYVKYIVLVCYTILILKHCMQHAPLELNKVFFFYLQKEYIGTLIENLLTISFNEVESVVGCLLLDHH